jgi:hypothetical protein
MRTRTTILFVLLSLAAATDKQETLQQLVARAEAAHGDDRVSLYLEAAQRQLRNADELYVAGKSDEGHAAVDDVTTYSAKAHDAAIESGKKLKNAEIVVRKMAEKLRDIKRTLNFEDQGPVQTDIDKLESLRTDLLTHMFGKGKK